MPDNKVEVQLLKRYAEEASITRPEVGTILGKTVGQIAGVHRRNLKQIGIWPTLDKTRRVNRGCQFPTTLPDDTFDLCGADRGNHDLLCKAHRKLTWAPPLE